MSITIKADYGKTNGVKTKDQCREDALALANRICRDLEECQNYDITIKIGDDREHRQIIVKIDFMFYARG